LSRKVAQAAIEAVARRFSGNLDQGPGPKAVLTLGGRRAVLDVMTMRARAPSRARVIGPRLRFDKVALSLVARLRTALWEFVPDDRTIVVTVTAPIRVPAKTAAAVEEKVHRLLTNRARPARLRAMIHGNQVQVRILPGGTRRTSKVVGFVHNPDSDASVLIGLTRRFLACIGSGRRVAGERWLVIANQAGLLPPETYRHVCSGLALRTVYERLLVVLPGGRIESLR
jgi:hypothetical protein